ncbi:MAG TPA: NAD(P)-binding protein [Candidatus Nanopelagicales bacterium]|nr:NAD(P)-binding protein [Candidatus Nanopelagicales bacterium]
MSETDLLVVGAGLSGVTAAVTAQQAGANVQVVDRGRAIGGRMASRRLRDTGTAFDGRVVDYGASYFTVSDPDFRLVVEELIAAGIVRPWTDTFHVHTEGIMAGVKTGPMRYAAPAGLRSVVEHLSQSLSTIVTETHIERIDITDAGVRADHREAQRVALCMPQPQAERIVDSGMLPDVNLTWEPVIAVTLVFEEQQWLDIDGVFVNDDPVITWIADDGKRRGDDAPVLVAHVNPVFAAGHLEDPSGVLPNVIAAVRRVLGIDELPAWTWAHRWSLARPIAGNDEPYWLHPELPLGLAGDAWAGGPRVEAAWLSGRALGGALAADSR